MLLICINECEPCTCMLFVNCPISGRNFDQFQLHRGEYRTCVRRLHYELKTAFMWDKICSQVQVEPKVESRTNATFFKQMNASSRDVQQSRLAIDFFKQFPSRIFCNSASFEVYYSDALNSKCCISKSS